MTIVFATIGWLGMVAVALWLTIAGIYAAWLCFALGGRREAWPFVMLSLGLVVLMLAVWFAPFHLTVAVQS